MVRGKVPACHWVIAACKRHRADLKRKRFQYRYDPAKAERACRFIERLPHVKGKWASRGEKIHLEPWQVFIVCSLFGWIHKKSGRYRFRVAYVEVPRKNAKSTLAAGIGLYKFAADGEHGAEVYSGATTEKQAWEVFRPAHTMVTKTPALMAALGIKAPKKSLVILRNGSRFEPIIGSPGDGASPSCAIVDEYHEHKTDVLYDTMITGMGARENPLQLTITTAGSDRAGPCFALHLDAQKVLDGKVVNEEFFCVIYTVDAGDDWKSKAALIKANPNYEVSVLAEYLERQQRDAINSARKQNTFKTKHLDVWVNAAVAWINMASWDRLADESLRLEDFAGQDCIIALDAATKLDIFAKVYLFSKVVGEKKQLYAFGKFYLNEAKVEDSKGSHYEGWAHDGWIEKTPGNITSFSRVLDDLVEDTRRFNVREVPHDPWQMAAVAELAQEREDWPKSVEFVAIPQTVQNLSPAMKELEAQITDAALHHNGDPVMGWGVSNVVCKTDAKDNIFPRKQNAESKIDPALALILAVGRHQVLDGSGGSVYETRGVIAI